jgi:hypothetical protein
MESIRSPDRLTFSRISDVVTEAGMLYLVAAVPVGSRV